MLLKVFLKRLTPREERRAGCTSGKRGRKGKERQTGERTAADWPQIDRQGGMGVREGELEAQRSRSTAGALERQRCCELRPKENPGQRKRTLAREHTGFLSFLAPAMKLRKAALSQETLNSISQRLEVPCSHGQWPGPGIPAIGSSLLCTGLRCPRLCDLGMLPRRDTLC